MRAQIAVLTLPAWLANSIQCVQMRAPEWINPGKSYEELTYSLKISTPKARVVTW